MQARAGFRQFIEINISLFARRPYWWLFFVFLTLFFLLTPMTGDDFTWASYYRSLSSQDDLLSSFKYLYENVNGRILGNALEFFLINYPLLSSVVRATILTGIAYLLSRIMNVKNTYGLVAISALAFFPSLGIFKQAIVWSAGFYNYAAPVLVLLLLYVMIQSTKKTWIRYVIIFFLSILACLFVENVTVVTLCAMIAWGIYDLLRLKKFNYSIVVSVVGLIIGALLMFNSPIYGKVASGQDGYRSISGADSSEQSFISSAISNAGDIKEFLIYDLIHVYTVIVVLVLALLYSSQLNRKNRTGLIKVAMGGAIGGLSLLYILKSVSIEAAPKYEYTYTIAIYLLFSTLLACLVTLIYTLIKKRSISDAISSSILLSILYISPLLVVTPFGFRNFYLTYILLVLAAGLLAKELSDRYDPIRKLDGSWVYYAGGIAATGMIMLFAGIKVVEVSNSRKAERQLERGASELVLKKYPFRGLLHDGESGNKQERLLGDYNCQYSKCTFDREIYIRYE